jgi:hypothetical protein
MLRRRSGLLLCGVAFATVVVVGCGRDDFENDPRPAVPLEVSAKISERGVAVSPKEFGSGLVNLTVANLATQPATFVIRGPVDADTDEIPPAGTGTIKVDLKTGSYEASVDGFAAAPATFTVGAPRPSGKNDLLLP